MTTPAGVIGRVGTPFTYATGGLALPQATINVASTVGFPTSGSLTVHVIIGGLYSTTTVNYTGKTVGSFTGCTGGTGTSTGGGDFPILSASGQLECVACGWDVAFGPTQLGPDFAIFTVTSAIGTPVIGDVLKGGTSLATTTVAQVISTGGTTVVFANSTNGIFQAAEAITTFSGSGTLAGTFSSIVSPGGSPQSPGLWFNGKPYLQAGRYVLVFDGTYWTIATTLSANTIIATGLHIIYINGMPFIGVVWSDATAAKVSRALFDGNSWVTKELSTTLFGGGILGPQRQIVFESVLYFASSGTSSSDNPVHYFWNPADDSFGPIYGGTSAGDPLPGGGGNYSGLSTNARASYIHDFISYNANLYLLAQDADNTASIYVLSSRGTLATWTRVLSFNLGNVTAFSGAFLPGMWSLFAPDDGFLYAIFFATDGATSGGWVVEKITSFTLFGYSQVQGTVFPTGPAYPGSSFNPAGAKWHPNVDDVSVGGSPLVLLITDAFNGATFGPSALATGGINALAWVGPSASAQPASSAMVYGSLPTCRPGGGDRFFGPITATGPRQDILITNLTFSGNGILISYKMPNLSTVTTGSPFALPQATIPVSSTAGFPSSGKILVTSGSGVQTVSYTGTAGNTFTGCTGGIGTVSTGALVQCLQTIEFLASTNAQPPQLAMTLNSPSRGTVSFNAIADVPADGASNTVVWNYLHDGVTNFERVSIQPSLLVPLVGGPLAQFLVDAVVLRAGAKVGFAADAVVNKRAGGAVQFQPAFPPTRRAGALTQFTIDLQQIRGGAMRQVTVNIPPPTAWQGIVDQNLELTESTSKGTKDDAVNQFLGLQERVSRTGTFARSILTPLGLVERASLVWYKTVSSVISLSQSVHRIRAVNIRQSLNLIQSLVATSFYAVKSTMTLTSTPATRSTFNRSLTQTLSLLNQAIAWKSTTPPPCTDSYVPPHPLGVLNHVTFSCTGLTNLTIRPPKFGNRDDVDTQTVVRKNRGGQYRIGRNVNWANVEILRMSWDGLVEADATNLITFLQGCAGLQVTLVDHENRTWTGVILTPVNEVIQNLRTCAFETAIEFRGSLT